VAESRSAVGGKSGAHQPAPQQRTASEVEEASQRVGPLVEVPGLLREFGADPAEVARGAGIDQVALDSPESRIPYLSTGRLLRECVVKTGCQHFALLVGQRIRLAHLGLPGQLMRHSQTLGAAFRTFVVYHHLNSQGLAKFLVEKDGVATLGSFVYQKGTEHVDQIYDIDVAATLSVIRELCGAHWLPERVLFSHTKPIDIVPYRRFFRAQCRFDCERTALLFPSRLLEFRLPDADPKQLRILHEQARAREDFGLVFRLRRSLRALLLAEAASGDEVAKLLSMHRRTLDRRLKTEGTTFQEVLDEVRFEAACQLLDTARIPITEIAATLGYAETSAFSRAFRRWSGTTPLERRRKSQKEPSHKTHRLSGARHS
jgi:AraC-like DNA-binding protein